MMRRIIFCVACFVGAALVTFALFAIALLGVE